MSPLVLCLRLPRRMEEGGLRLRRLMITDAPFVSAAMGDELHPGESRLSLWWRLRSSHIVTYCVCLDSRRIGLLGITTLTRGPAAELSLVIFPGIREGGTERG